MLRVATVNVNGLRAAERRGFGAWLTACAPDVVALQEVRASAAAVPTQLLAGWHLTYDQGVLAGRNGVAVLTRAQPIAARAWGGTLHHLDAGGGWEQRALRAGAGGPGPAYLARELREFADHGRYVEVDLAEAPVTVGSLYLPKGGLPAHLQRPGRMREAPDGGARFERKLRFMRGFARQLADSRRRARAQGRELLLMGDLNIAHTQLDVAAWRRNLSSEGFLPEERAWLGSLIGPRRLVDVVRRLSPGVPGPYSWWSWLGSTYANDAGWRIDYQLATPSLARRAVRSWVDREMLPTPDGPMRLSDHAPVVVDYDL